MKRKRPCDRLIVVPPKTAKTIKNAPPKTASSLKQVKKVISQKIIKTIKNPESKPDKSIKKTQPKTTKQVICENCNTTFTRKDSLIKHIKSRCRVLKNKELSILNDLKTTLNNMESKINNMESELHLIKNTPTVVTNNITNNLTILTYMTSDKVKEIFDNHYTLDTFLGNEKALADFTLKYFLIGEDKPVYLCTDKSRQKCSFIDDRGNHIEDNNQEILLRLTSEGFNKVQEKYKEITISKYTNSIYRR